MRKQKCDAVKCENEAKYLIKLEARGLKIRPCKVCEDCLRAQQQTFGNVLEWRELPPETKIINRSFEQINCPTCRMVVMIPEVNFRIDDDQFKQRHCCCVQCGCMILIQLKKDGDIKVYRQNPAYIYPDEPQFGIHTGVQLTTDIYIQKNPITDKYEARAGMSMMGNVNFPSSIGACPFDINFHDNVLEGEGDSPKEAVDELVKQATKTCDGLWAV